MSLLTLRLIPFVVYLALIGIMLGAKPVFAASELLEKQGRTDDLKDPEAGSNSEPLIFKNTLEFDNEFEGANHETAGTACEASLTLDYSQKETVLAVETFITNYTCAASRGSYQVSVDYLDQNGVLQSLTSVETWEKSDNDDYLGEHQYPINIESEVSRVKGRLLGNDACWCVATNSTESVEGDLQ